MGIIQTLVSDYERDKLSLHAEMVVRFAQALEVTTDELLGIRVAKENGRKSSLKLVRRLKRIEELPSAQEKTLLKTIKSLLLTPVILMDPDRVQVNITGKS
jgi:transcriptional regulator with XRE-family HTH domain